MQSFQTKVDDRRRTFVLLAGQIERQLREAYDRQFKAGVATQSSLADKLGINRSAVHHRLMGHTNMTIETIADMVWALGHAIKVDIYDPAAILGVNYCMGTTNQSAPLAAHAGVSTGIANPLPKTITDILNGSVNAASSIPSTLS